MTSIPDGNYAKLSPWAPRMLAVLRIMTALLFLGHGLVKLIGFPDGAAPGQVPLMTIYGLAAVLEVTGGTLLILGLFTRPVAFVLSGQMAVAYFMGHASASFFPVLNGGEMAIMFCFVFLYLVAAGPGAWSIDGARSKSHV